MGRIRVRLSLLELGLPRVNFGLRMGFQFDPNNFLSLNPRLTLTVTLNPNLPNWTIASWELFAKNDVIPGP